MASAARAFGYQAKKAGAGNKRASRAGSDAKLDGDNAPRSLHMDWCYRMISSLHMDGSYNYSDESLRWLSRRVDNADGAQDDDDETWWEYDKSAAKVQPLEMPKMEQEKDADEANLPTLSLQDVLDTPVFRADFRAHLEENYSVQGLNFLEAHQAWADIDHKADPRKFIKGARGLFDQYVDSSAEEIVTVPADVRDKVAHVVKQAQDANVDKDNTDLFLKLRNVFEEARKHVLANVESNLFPRFLKSDDYQEMLAVHFEDDSESKGAAAAYKGHAWENDKGYKSLQVKVVGIDGLDQPRKTWVSIQVDSRAYKTGGVSRAAGQTMHTFNEDFSFPLMSTTQHVRLTVLTNGLVGNNVFLGRLFIPIAAVQANQNAPYRAKLLPRAYGEKVCGEAVLQFTMSTDEAKETQHKLEPEDETSVIADKIRGLVSKKKIRFKEDGFDLDLTYVTDRIIAMGFPSEGVEGVYRNNMEDVQRFFEKRHPMSYKVYNLCSERHYDASRFKGRVMRVPFDDHNPPTLEQIRDFCRDAHEWLAEHPQHVISVHCKAGKGRTGTLIAAYMVYSGLCKDAEQALRFFAVQRTSNNKGVTIPSQIRYVHYFDYYCSRRRRGLRGPPSASLFLKSIQFNNIPTSLDSGDIWFVITQNNRKGVQYKSKGRITADRHKSTRAITFSFGTKPILLTENVRIDFFHQGSIGKEKMFQFWFNTRYVTAMTLDQHERDKEQGIVRYERRSIETAGVDLTSSLDRTACGDMSVIESKFAENVLRLVFSKWAIDKLCKDKKHKSYPANFNVELLFKHQETHLRGSDMPLPPPPMPGAEPTNAPAESKQASSASAAPGASPVPAVDEADNADDKEKGAKKKTVLKIGKLLDVKL